MNLYLISQDENTDYDTYDSAIVAAENDKEAVMIHPDGDGAEWGGRYSAWASNPINVTATEIGKADKSVEKGIVLTSFNAG
ncbi:hypothetical protein NVP1164O_14 [Vibrio phage 1.164.O._10N.261.51.A7]|nr:hypothetical protein NVP1164O_14 [Vibrio phage 1.164.O._10N.261.51.A7]